MINPFTAAKQTLGRTVGAIGGVLNSQPLRTAGGQLTGGARTFNVFNPPTTSAYEQVNRTNINYSPYIPGVTATAPGNVLGAGTTGGGSNPGTSSVPAGQDGQYNDINNQVDDFGAIIDRDYETSMGALASQEQGLQGQAGTAEQTIRAGYAPAKTAIGEEQATREAGLGDQESLATRQATSATQQARDLFRQMQQQNIAQLSGLGISSSSVAEALAERLGVETARRLAGITGSRDEVVQNIGKERTRIQTFYKQKVADLEGQMSAGIANIQQSLLDGIRQINSARQQAASDKANRRAELMSRAQTAVAQLQSNAQQFQQSLQMWNEQKQSGLASAQQFVVTPTDFSALTNAQNSVAELKNQGLNYTPSYSIAPTGKFTTTLKPDEEDDLLNPFAN